MAAMVAVLVLLSGFTSLLTTSAQSETPPDKPPGLSTEAGDTQVRLSWEDPEDSTIDEYELWQIAERATLTAANTDLDDQFGNSVAVAGDAAVVGMPGDDDTQNNSGAVLVFTRDSNGDWSQAAKLKTGDAGADDNFGTSVALDGNTMVVGAFWDDDNGSQSGSVYVFTEPTGGWGGWDSLNDLAKAALTAKIVPAGVAAGDEFGRSVAVDDSTGTIVAGAWHDGSNEGSAYVFTEPTGGWSGWGTLTDLAKANLTATLTASSVAIDGDTVVVGAEGKDSGEGAAYVFDIVDWEDIAGSDAATTSYIVTGLTNDIDHTFRVRAVDGTEASDPSISVAGTPKAASYAPARPLNFSVTQTGIGEVELTWDAHRYPLTGTGYEYSQNDGGGVTWTPSQIAIPVRSPTPSLAFTASRTPSLSAPSTATV